MRNVDFGCRVRTLNKPLLLEEDPSDITRHNRRAIRASLKMALSHNEVIDNEGALDFKCSKRPSSAFNKIKRGKGLAYDRARRAGYKRSERKHARRNNDEECVLAGTDRTALSQVRQHILQHKESILSIFSGYILPINKAEEARIFMRKIRELEQTAAQLAGSEKHEILEEIKSVRGKLNNLYPEVHPYGRHAYRVYKHTKREIAKIRTRRKSGLSLDRERAIWKRTKRDLHNHDLAKECAVFQKTA